jgi:hypothetical protein
VAEKQVGVKELIAEEERMVVKEREKAEIPDSNIN